MRAILRCVSIGTAFVTALAVPVLADAPRVGNIIVDARSSGVINSFDPLRTIGAGVDSQTTGAIETIYAPPDVRAMLSTGLGPVTYRLYTELSVQQWHWNPVGSWSDPRGEGYWRGSTAVGGPVVNSFGYRLPHRGFTHDQGNDDNYSRLDDGNPATYWKSDPYLAQPFTGESDADHPQWALVDLGARNDVDAIRLTWVAPYAVTYAVQYWTGSDALNDPAHGHWATFRNGAVDRGRGGTVTLRLDDRPIAVRYVRVLMTISSSTCDTHGPGDLRNCVGFALAEIGIGRLGSGGAFVDLVRHEPSKRQTSMYVSSVDPWHAPVYRVYDQEQPGLDILFRSGVTRGEPAMLPVGMLYGTPDDAAGEIRYVEANGYPISYVELGEEPDGQYIAPEDYAALYLQWAHALHAVDPTLKLGGPVFQGATSDVQYWPDANGNVSWLQRFLAYLRDRGGASQLAFMSFEHYPFDGCGGSVQHNLFAEAGLVRSIVDIWHRDGIPQSLPLLITG
jgi:hypothetical protein